ncbi:Uu.00g005160.m01.CDS01 [Anthostomella pinea]|uniref:Uu.00g005160.m01.CDS01 n=1 Tax=Anthostomella pinea TaxID=933095 RepID=A0AAI8VL16_9PEZI|nr:Uu.00g005160.m01.CDS01 [Anthostomella pinea]
MRNRTSAGFSTKLHVSGRLLAVPIDAKNDGPYEALDPSRREIRLLDLLPSKDADAQIHGNLRTVSLEDRPRCEALSYTWGSPSEGRSILIGKVYHVGVTNNLFRALRWFRRSRHERTMWIDAICINQSDTAERCKQVAIMGDIYKSAECVDVWLGDVQGPLPRMLTGRLHRSCYAIRMAIQELRDNRMSPKFALELFRSGCPWVRRRQAEKLEAAIRDSEPKWAERAWVRQEFLLNSTVFLCFGSERTKWEAEKIWFLEKIGTIEALDAKIKPDWGFRHASDKGSKERWPLNDIRSRLRNVEASDPRDMVYSLLGVLPLQQAALIDADYGVPCADVYAKATFASITYDGHLLTLSNTVFKYDDIPFLPSWANNFRHEFPHAAFTKETSLYHMDFLPEPLLGGDCKALTVYGLPLDSITSVVPLPEGADHRRIWRSNSHTMSTFAQALSDGLDKFTMRLADDTTRLFQDHPWLPSVRLRADEETAAGSLLDWCRIKSYSSYLNVVKILSEVFSRWHRSIEPPFDDRPFQYLRHLGDGFFFDHARIVDGDACFFTTKTGLVGLAPGTLKVADQVVLAPRALLILRTADDNRWTFRGLAYVHGVSGVLAPLIPHEVSRSHVDEFVII